MPGRSFQSTTDEQNKFKYQGKERDIETGYDYFEARFYDSAIGRFLQVDPMDFINEHQSSYVGMDNNPINLVDPSGMDSEGSNGYKPNHSVESAHGYYKPDGTLVIDEIIDDGDPTLYIYGSSEYTKFKDPIKKIYLPDDLKLTNRIYNAAINAGYTEGYLKKSILWNEKLFDGMMDLAEFVSWQAALSPIATFSSLSTTANTHLTLIRSEYVRQVLALRRLVPIMKAAGYSNEKIARTLYYLRRQIGLKFKSLTPTKQLNKIYKRNLKKYGDELGPSIEYLRKTKSWDDIIKSASKPSGRDLGL